MWKALDEDKKKKYIDEAKEAMVKFKEQYGDNAFKHAPKTKKKKKVDADRKSVV